MKAPTLMTFLAESLTKAGLEVDTYHLSDNSSSGINIYRDKGGEKFIIELQFTGDGLRLQDVKIFKREFTETDQTRIL